MCVCVCVPLCLCAFVCSVSDQLSTTISYRPVHVDAESNVVSGDLQESHLVRMYVEAGESGRTEVKSVFSANILSYHATTKTKKVFDIKYKSVPAVLRSLRKVKRKQWTNEQMEKAMKAVVIATC